jgi:hypothetical protein
MSEKCLPLARTTLSTRCRWDGRRAAPGPPSCNRIARLPECKTPFERSACHLDGPKQLFHNFWTPDFVRFS